MHLLLPNTFVPLPELPKPIFYLAGPIRGADDWQALAATTLNDIYEGHCTIVNPCRYTEDHALHHFRIKGNEKRFEHQTDWERYYMNQAASADCDGCLIFWLPCESTTNPRPTEEGPYASDTRFELGYWSTNLWYQRVVFGAEKDFPRLHVIKRNVELTYDDRLPPNARFHSTLKTTLRAAMLRAERRS